MNTLNRQQLLWMLAAIGLAVSPHVGHLPLALVIWFFCIFGWRLLGVWQPVYLPKAAAKLLAIILGLGLLVGFRPEQWGAASGAAVFVVALAIKLLELYDKRDAYLVCYLGFILVGAEFLFRQDLLATGYGLVVCGLLLAALLAVNSYALQTMSVLWQTAVILVQALPMTIVLFVLFPRLQAPTWSWLETSRQNKFEMTDTLKPGSIDRLALSPELVFRVKFEGEMPPRNQLYWRGPVFSFTDGKTWSVVEDPYVARFQKKPGVVGKSYRYTLLLEPQKHNWIYAMDMPMSYDDSVHRDSNYQLISHRKPGEAAEFAITSHPDYNTGYITKTEYRQNRQLPDQPSDRIVELVKQLHGFDEEPDVFMRNVLDYFRQQHFSYTLTPPLMEDRPIEQFLFEEKIGFCSHYATAFAYLMRVADIPARVVGGYQGGAFNDVGQFLEVRQVNAHAWVEVWLQGKGWVRVDPTTAILPERVEQPVNVSQQVETGAVSLVNAQAAEHQSQGFGLEHVRQAMESADYQWQRWIVRYGNDQQSSQTSGLDISDLMQKVYGLLVGVGLIMWLLLRWMFRSRTPAEEPEVKLYRRFCKNMASIGVPIRQGEGAVDFAVRAKAEKPELSSWIDNVTQAFVALRYCQVSDEDNLKLLKKNVKLFPGLGLFQRVK